MAIADKHGLPVSIVIESASPHEVKLVHETLENIFVLEKPEKIIADKAYDSDKLDNELKEEGIELIIPHRADKRTHKTQDGRKLRPYKRRWKIERLLAWLHNFRRIY